MENHDVCNFPENASARKGIRARSRRSVDPPRAVQAGATLLPAVGVRTANGRWRGARRGTPTAEPRQQNPDCAAGSPAQPASRSCAWGGTPLGPRAAQSSAARAPAGQVLPPRRPGGGSWTVERGPRRQPLLGGGQLPDQPGSSSRKVSGAGLSPEWFLVVQICGVELGRGKKPSNLSRRPAGPTLRG